jgi:hypothetical protein
MRHHRHPGTGTGSTGRKSGHGHDVIRTEVLNADEGLRETAGLFLTV